MKKFLSNLFLNKNKSRTISFVSVFLVYILIEVITNITNVPRLFTSLLVPTCAYIVVALL